MTEQLPMFDLTDPAYVADPYATWAQMRVAAPLYQDAKDMWHLTRYEDCVAALKEQRFTADRTEALMRKLSPAERSQVAYYEQMRLAMMLLVDPPDHTRLRRLVARAFTPRAAEALRPRIQQITDELLAAAPDDFDLMRDLALPLPYYVIADMIGVPREDRAIVKAWSVDFGRALGVFTFTPELGAKADASLRAFSDYLRPIVCRLRESPEPNLFSTLVAAGDDGEKLSEDELFATAMLLIIAGHETTTALIGNGIWLLLNHPEQLQLLRENPSLIGGVVDEVLRCQSPIILTTRVAREDMQFAGRQIAQGAWIAIMLAAANRDPEVFTDPERFDITRTPNPHVAFGDFIHKCIGAPLALVEGQVAIGTLMRRYPELRFADAPIERRSFVLPGGLGLEKVPLHLGRAVEA